MFKNCLYLGSWIPMFQCFRCSKIQCLESKWIQDSKFNIFGDRTYWTIQVFEQCFLQPKLKLKDYYLTLKFLSSAQYLHCLAHVCAAIHAKRRPLTTDPYYGRAAHRPKPPRWRSMRQASIPAFQHMLWGRARVSPDRIGLSSLDSTTCQYNLPAPDWGWAV